MIRPVTWMMHRVQRGRRRVWFEIMMFLNDKPMFWKWTWGRLDDFGMKHGFLIINPDDSCELIRNPKK